MPQLNKSETVRKRSRHLLQKLIAFANHELIDYDHLEGKIRVRWSDLETKTPKLIVKTEIRFLAALVSPTPDAKTKEHIKQDLRTLKDFVGCLEDNRDRTQGTGLWHFTLKLWHRSVEDNLNAFDTLWQQKKALSPRPAKTQVKPKPPIDEPPTQAPIPKPTSLEELSPHHNLPARDYGTYIGRQHIIQQLHTLLLPDHPVARISLTGIGGIGKTALALETAHHYIGDHARLATAKDIAAFSALIFVSAKTQRLTPQGILPTYRYSRTLLDIFRAIAQTLKRPDLLTVDFDHQLTNIYNLLAHQRTLLIIDNLEALAQKDQQTVLAFLYELPTTVKAIVTSRTHITLDAVIPLTALSKPESTAFIAHQVSLKAIAITPQATEQLYQHTGGVPAAMVYALGQVAAGYNIPQVLPRITLQASDYCKYYLKGTVDSLAARPAHRVLNALALFPSAAYATAISEVAELTESDVSESLAQLQQFAFIHPTTTQNGLSFSMLPLTREYILSQLPANKEQSARIRWSRWYQHWLASYRKLNWREWHDYSPIDDCWEHVQSVVEWCIATDRYQDFGELWQGLRGYTHLRGYWHERLTWLEWWLKVAQQKQDALCTIQALRDLSWSLTLMGGPEQFAQAKRYLDQAWDQRHHTGLAFQQDLATEIAVLYLFQNQCTQVRHWLTKAHKLLAKADLLPTDVILRQRRLDYYTAQLHYRQAEYAKARELYETLLSEVRSDDITDFEQAEVYILNWLVDIALQEANVTAAQNLLAQSWPMIERRQDMRSQAFHQRSQAQLEKLKGDLPSSQSWSQRAKASFESLGMYTQAKEMQAWIDAAN
ncbi:MAG: AAA family ATPase [Cyanobacteria bacterium J06581_3]